MRKGVTPVVASVLIVLITVGASASFYSVVQGVMEPSEDTEESFGMQINDLDPEACYWRNNDTKLVFRNTFTESVNASKLDLNLNDRLKDQEEYSFDPSIVEPQETFEMEIDALVGREEKLDIVHEGRKLTHYCSDQPTTNLYETSFEVNEEGWEEYTTGKDITTSTTSATDEASIGEESLKAGREDGVNGYGGMAKTFNTDYDILELDLKADIDSYGRVGITIKNEETGNHDTIWRNNSQGNSVDSDWETKSFNISDYPAEFTLIIGNDDDSDYHGNGDHGWTIWADDVELAKK